MRNLTEDHRERLRAHGRRVGGLTRKEGRCSSVALAPCCKCIYGVGIGIKKAGKILNMHQCMVRKVLIKAGVYKGNTGRKSYPWKNGKICVGKAESLLSVYGYDRELIKLRTTDESRHWGNHNVVTYHKHGEQHRKNAKAQWQREKNNPVFRENRRANIKSFRQRASKCSVWRMVQAIRSRTSAAIRRSMHDGEHREERTIELLGCSYSFLRKWIKHQFTKGMSFDNYGEWQVDHVIPIASFDLRSEAQRKICFHYTNLRPMWAEDNNAKSDKIVDCQPELAMSL